MIETEKLLNILRLTGVAETLQQRNKEAIKSKISYLDFVKIILQDEVLHRSQKKFEVRMKAAKFKNPKTIEDFDFKFNPKINEALIKDLTLCNFVKEAAPIHIVGPSGTGKSHIAQALAKCAIMKGYDSLFISQSALTSNLQLAYATNSVHRFLKRISNVTVLIIDDFGIKPLSDKLEDFLHDVMDERYEKQPTIITSNLHFDEWSDAFKNKIVASAVIDRLKGNAYEIILTGKSYRQIKKTTQK